MSIGAEIIEILKVDIMEDEDLDISLDEDLLNSSALDSIALIRLVAEIEKKYDFKIPPPDLVIENFINIEAMANYVSKRLSSK